MSENLKFAEHKHQLIANNEQQYGREIRNKYGTETVKASNAKLMGLTADQYERVQDLSLQINDHLKQAMTVGDPGGELAQKACDLHREWISYFWPEYSKEAHLGLGQLYVDDPRFKQYYDDIAVGCAEFLRDALVIYCK
jgi:hypothetical protein